MLVFYSISIVFVNLKFEISLHYVMLHQYSYLSSLLIVTCIACYLNNVTYIFPLFVMSIVDADKSVKLCLIVP